MEDTEFEYSGNEDYNKKHYSCDLLIDSSLLNAKLFPYFLLTLLKLSVKKLERWGNSLRFLVLLDYSQHY